ncbi:hypothetical protein R3Q06_30650 [Rhodococcus erythropolis]|uniref:hypothetical protein n=1 Tax=Rhodococcus erythropolis TaxID=1833 RepID=UPI00294A9615|nr:hypothetical protein [Rhodococcus erythropolis]MDV6277852.1 hypothetical protein [Rhodococcus erythropolis]
MFKERNIANRLRAQRRIFLTVAAVTVSACTVAGVASATPTTTIDETWPIEVKTVSLANGTDQPLTGEWYFQDAGNTATIDFSKPLAPGETRTKGIIWDQSDFYSMYSWGRVCYNHSWWNFPRYGPQSMWDGFHWKVIPTNWGGLETSDEHGDLHHAMIETEHGTVTCPQ